MDEAGRKDAALAEYRKKLLSHRVRVASPCRLLNVWTHLSIHVAAQELEAKVKSQREELKVLRATFDKTEDDLKALQSVGQIIGEVLRQLDEERCAF